MEHRGDFGIPRIDLTGKRYGRIVVVRFHSRDQNGRYVWLVRCDCGTEKAVERNTLAQYATFEACRCEISKFSAKAKTLNRERANWQAIMNRCLNVKCHNYDRYGGSGIYVCDRWKSFAAFKSDMGSRPSPSHTIDRINNADSYTCGKHDLCDDCRAKNAPANCRWATKKEQGQNTEANVNLTGFGETHCIAEWARKFNMTHATIAFRIKKGMSLEEAVQYVPSPRQHLTSEIVRDIRRRSASGDSISLISRVLCISYGNVKAVVTRRTWRHVE